MNLVVLISCMHEKDHGIIERTNVLTDVVVVNQCDNDSEDKFCFVDKNGKEHNALFINTTERGLSRSRNMALKNAIKADICLISDDDERLVDNYEEIILGVFNQHPKLDVASFAFDRKDKHGNYPTEEKNMGIYRISKTSSVELAFKRKSVLDSRIEFDVKMGSGTGNGGGEDTKFMLDCRRKGLKMRFFPYTIGALLSYNSQWFHGWDKKLMMDTGWTAKRGLGYFLGYLFVLYKVISGYKDYKKVMNPLQAFCYLNMGFFSTR